MSKLKFLIVTQKQHFCLYNTYIHIYIYIYIYIFSQRDNIYLLDLKYNKTYQNTWGKTKVRLGFIP